MEDCQIGVISGRAWFPPEPVCGNFVCEPGEDEFNCSQDCGGSTCITCDGTPECPCDF